LKSSVSFPGVVVFALDADVEGAVDDGSDGIVVGFRGSPPFMLIGASGGGDAYTVYRPECDET
jgi:hypothetical protein